MAVTMLELFRTLTSFAPKRVDLRGAPWEGFVDWAIAQGLGPLVAYNLEYRLGATQVPEWARHRLLSIYQGSANDNVMKLVNLKQSIDELEGRKIVLIGSASFAESLYPHIAFRPVIDVRLACPVTDLEPLTTWLRRAEFKPIDDAADPAGAQRVLTDTRTTIFLHAPITHDSQAHRDLLQRALPMRAFGSSAYRLDLEDALLVQALFIARAGFDVPMLELLDLRELMLEASSMGGPYARPIDAGAVKARASQWKLDRALWSAVSIVERLWPETEGAAAKLKPELNFLVREGLERLVVKPVSEIGRSERFRGTDALRSLLTGD